MMVASVLAALLVQIPLESGFQYQRPPISEVGAVAFSSLFVVSPIRRLEAESRKLTSIEGTQDVTAVIDEVSVLSSTTQVPAVIRIVSPTRGSADRIVPLVVGKRYLILSSASNVEGLSFPLPGFVDHRLNDGIDPEKYAQLEKHSSSEFIGLAAFETGSMELVRGQSDPMSSLLSNIGASLQGASRATVLQVCGFMEGVHGAVGRFSANANSKFVQIMRAAAQSLPASDRARVYFRLADWDVPGSYAALYDAMRDSNQDPDLFSLAGDSFSIGWGSSKSYENEFAELMRDAVSAEERQSRYDATLELGLAAKSRNVKAWFFVRVGGNPDVGKQRRFLAQVESQDDELAQTMLTKMADWHRDREHVPQHVLENGVRRWTNRVALQEYWRQKLGST